MLTLTRNDVSPALSRLVAAAKNKMPVLRAMGTTFKSITEGTFNSVGANYRPAPWAPKLMMDAEGNVSKVPSNLQKSTTMAKSFHMDLSANSVTVSNPMRYAAIHQFGGTIYPKSAKALRFKIPNFAGFIYAKKVVIPARPFFPVLNGKLTPMAEQKITAAAQRMLNKEAGIV